MNHNLSLKDRIIHYIKRFIFFNDNYCWYDVNVSKYTVDNILKQWKITVDPTNRHPLTYSFITRRYLFMKPKLILAISTDNVETYKGWNNHLLNKYTAYFEKEVPAIKQIMFIPSKEVS